MLIPVFDSFLWSPETKQLYYEDEVSVGPSTYERALFTPPWYNFWSGSRYLNPVDYATAETADKILRWARKVIPGINFSLLEDSEVAGKISHPQRFLVATSASGREEKFGAGRLAFIRDKNGDYRAERSFFAELAQAGFPVLWVG